MGNLLSEYGNEHKGCCCPVNNDTSYLVEFDHDDDDYDRVVVDNNNNNGNDNQNQWYNNNNNNVNNVDSYGEFEVSLFANGECHGIALTDEDTDTLPCYDVPCQDPLVTTLVIVGTYILSWIKKVISYTIELFYIR